MTMKTIRAHVVVEYDEATGNCHFDGEHLGAIREVDGGWVSEQPDGTASLVPTEALEEAVQQLWDGYTAGVARIDAAIRTIAIAQLREAVDNHTLKYEFDEISDGHREQIVEAMESLAPGVTAEAERGAMAALMSTYGGE